MVRSKLLGKAAASAHAPPLVKGIVSDMRRRGSRGLALGVVLLLSAVVCPAQIPFFNPADSSATVIQLTGSVSVLKDSYPWALAVGDTVRPQQMIISGADGYAVLRVADGSTFEIFPNSKVIFRANPGNLKDLVDLTLGRIRVLIQKIGGQPNPNTVRTPTAVISVRGTVFDVVVDETDESTLVAVTEGLVSVRHAIQPSKTERFVGAGEVLRVYKDQPLAKNRVDRGAVARRVFDGLLDALLTAARGSRSPSSGSTAPPTGGAPSGPGLPGDTQGTEPPPPPPPPPPNN